MVADALISTPSISSRLIGPPLVTSNARRAASNLPSPISVKAHQQAISVLAVDHFRSRLTGDHDGVSLGVALL